MRYGDGIARGDAARTQLEALGIKILNGYRAENADIRADVTVVGNAISRGNPELEEVLNRKLVYRSQAEIVKELFIRGRRSLVIAGTHGKTTTTSIAAWICEVGGLDPSFLVGGIVQLALSQTAALADAMSAASGG